MLLLSPFFSASAQAIDISGFVNSINLQASQSFSDMIGESIYEESSKNSNRASSQQSHSNILNPAILGSVDIHFSQRLAETSVTNAK